MRRDSKKNPLGVDRTEEYVIRVLNDPDELLGKFEEHDIFVYDIRIRVPPEEGGEYLLMIRAQMGGERVIAFISGFTIFECLRNLVVKGLSGVLKWKTDERP